MTTREVVVVGAGFGGIGMAAELVRRGVEEPLIGGSISSVTVGARETAGVVGGAQTGYLRSYALVIALGVAVLVVVFISVQ